jgi:hypothetical protein
LPKVCLVLQVAGVDWLLGGNAQLGVVSLVGYVDHRFGVTALGFLLATLLLR